MKLSIVFVCLFVVENNNGNSGNDNNVLVDSFARSRNLSSHFITEPLPYLCFSNYLKISLLIARSHLVDFSTQLTRIFIFWFLYFAFYDKYQSYKYEKIQQGNLLVHIHDLWCFHMSLNFPPHLLIFVELK